MADERTTQEIWDSFTEVQTSVSEYLVGLIVSEMPLPYIMVLRTLDPTQRAFVQVLLDEVLYNNEDIDRVRRS